MLTNEDIYSTKLLSQKGKKKKKIVVNFLFVKKLRTC